MGRLRKRISEEIKEASKTPADKEELIPKGSDRLRVSTGSTLLDLAISGTRFHGGGIPAGILVEIFGPSGFGKTTILSEIGASAQAKGGFFLIGDGEHRLDKAFAQRMGLTITDDNYRMPQTVKDVEAMMLGTKKTTGKDIVDVIGVDSIASLIAEMDKSEKGDKRGSARAKEFHQLCRKAKGIMAERDRLVVFTNQIQDVQDAMAFGPKEKTPGGHAVPYYSSLRIRIGPAPVWRVKKKRTLRGVEHEMQSGIISRCYVYKSSVDVPYREADLYIMFNYGIDDIRGNLRFCKSATQDTTFQLNGESLGSSLDNAVKAIENQNLEHELKERTIRLWNEIQGAFEETRKPKVR